MHCASCATILTRALTKAEGVTSVNVNYGTEQATVEYDPQKVDVSTLVNVIKKKGYQAIPLDQDVHAGMKATETSSKKVEISSFKIDPYELKRKREQREMNRLKRLFHTSLLFSVPAFIIGMFFMEDGLFFTGFELPMAMMIVFVLATPVQFVVGAQFYKGAWRREP